MERSRHHVATNRPSRCRGGVATRALAAVSSSSAPAAKPTVVVVGGGWAGFGAALQLAKHGAAVTLVDASSSPGGLASGWRTREGRAVEGGVKGFWDHYRNVDSLAAELGLTGDESPFTPPTASGFWSPSGRTAVSPVLAALPRLPTPLGSLLYTDSPEFAAVVPLAARLSALPLVKALAEYDASDSKYLEYDAMSFAALCRSAGVDDRLYGEFLRPVLVALMFADPERLSAAAALDVLYGYVLATQSAFDVRWCRGSVAERLFSPLVKRIESLGGTVLGGRPVRHVSLGNGEGERRTVVVGTPDGGRETLEADGVVLAVGVGAARRLVETSPDLAATPLSGATRLDGADVCALRLWLDRRQTLQQASNVFHGFDRDCAGTLFDLNQLQDEYAAEPNSVLEVDLYGSESLRGLSDDALVERVMSNQVATLAPFLRGAKVTDASVLRFERGVTRFSPGSAAHLPRGELGPRVRCAGDWLWQGPGSHGARGLSQEKALVTGLRAADELAHELRLTGGPVPPARVLDVPPDEPHVAAIKALARR